MNNNTDLVLMMAANPTFSYDDFQLMGFNSQNTTIKDRSAYRQSKLIQDTFKTENGAFNEDAFDRFYNGALANYNSMSNFDYAKYIDSISSYDKNNMFVSPNKRNYQTWSFDKQLNPDHLENGLITFGQEGPRTKSIDELAQQSKALLNPIAHSKGAKARWADAPDNGFFSRQFWSGFFDTKVLAQWDSDGEHENPATGQMEKHVKGQYKLNEDGNYYYESLDGRDIYGRRVLNKMNVLTPENSWINKYDFFDSDDIEQKSVTGTVMKNLALVGSMFIPYYNVGNFIALTSMFTQSLGLLSQLGKMVGDPNSPTLSAIEGWSRSVNRQYAKTEAAQQDTWCLENIITSVADLTAQLQEQRAIFNYIPGLFKGYDYVGANGLMKQEELFEAMAKKTGFAEIRKDVELLRKAPISKLNPDIAGVSAIYKNSLRKTNEAVKNFMDEYNSIAGTLSKMYMAGLISSNLYEEARTQGLSSGDAAMLTLGRFAAEMLLLNTPIGNAIFPELRAQNAYDSLMRYHLVNKVMDKGLRDEVLALSSKIVGKSGNERMHAALDLIKRGYQIGQRRGITQDTMDTLKASLVNGFEVGLVNDIEEFLNDMAKQTYNWIKPEGVNFSGEAGPWRNKLDRYGMGMVSGLIGGTLTSMRGNFNVYHGLKDVTPDHVIEELVYKIRNGQLDQIKRDLTKYDILPKTLTFDIDEQTGLFKKGDKDNNMDKQIKEVIFSQLDMINQVLNENGANLSDQSYLKRVLGPIDGQKTLDSIRTSALAQSASVSKLLQEFNTRSKKLVNAVKAVEKLSHDTDEVKRSEKYQEQVKEATKSVNEAKKDVEEILDSKSHVKYIQNALLETWGGLSNYLAPVSLEAYTYFTKGTPFTKLSAEEKNKAIEAHKKYMENQGKDDINYIMNFFRDVLENTSDLIKNNHEEYIKSLDTQELKGYLTQLATLYNLRTTDIDVLPELIQQQSEFINKDLAFLLAGPESTALDQFKDYFLLRQEILDDPTLTNEEKQLKMLELELPNKAMKAKEQSYIDAMKTLEHFANAKFLNSEQKNILIEFLHRTKDAVLEIEADAMNFKRDHPELLQLLYPEESDYSYEDRFDELEEKIKNKPHTPIEENLNAFIKKITGDSYDLSVPLAKFNTLLNNTNGSLEVFTVDEDSAKQLRLLQEAASMYAAAIQGMRTDNIDLGNEFGFAATYNNVGRALGGNEFKEIYELPEGTAQVILQDIETLINKIDYVNKLYHLNKGNKIASFNRQKINSTLLLFKKLKYFAPVESKLSDAILNSTTLQNIIDESEGTPGNWNPDLNLSKEKTAQVYAEFANIQHALYEMFHKESGELISDDEIKNLLFNSEYNFDFLEAQMGDPLTEATSEIDDNTFYWWLTTHACTPAVGFENAYQEIYKNRKMAPIPAQKDAVKSGLSFILDGDAFSKFCELQEAQTKEQYNKLSDEQKKEYLGKVIPGFYNFKDEVQNDLIGESGFKLISTAVLPYIKYKNIMLIEGIAGSGKTKAVIKQIVDILKKQHPDILKNTWLVNTIDAERIKKLNDDHLKIEGAKVFNTESLMETITNHRGRINQNEDCQDYVVGKHRIEIGPSIDIAKIEGEAPKIIFIDEVTQLSIFELDAIQKFAEENGISVIALGDYTQNCFKGKIECEKNDDLKEKFTGLSLDLQSDRHNFARTGKLGKSVRTGNSLLNYNQEQSELLIQQIEKSKFDARTPIQGLMFQYQEQVGEIKQGDDVIKGTRITGDVEEVKKVVDKMIKSLKENEKIGYIFQEPKISSDPDNPTLYQILTSSEYAGKIELFTGVKAQGDEMRYYIIDPITQHSLQNNINSDGALEYTYNDYEELLNYLKYQHTGITRSTQGSILFLEKTPIIRDHMVQSQPTNNSVEEKFSDSDIEKLSRDQEEISKTAIINNELFVGKKNGLPYRERSKNPQSRNREQQSVLPGKKASEDPNHILTEYLVNGEIKTNTKYRYHGTNSVYTIEDIALENNKLYAIINDGTPNRKRKEIKIIESYVKDKTFILEDEFQKEISQFENRNHVNISDDNIVYLQNNDVETPLRITDYKYTNDHNINVVLTDDANSTQSELPLSEFETQIGNHSITLTSTKDSAKIEQSNITINSIYKKDGETYTIRNITNEVIIAKSDQNHVEKIRINEFIEKVNSGDIEYVQRLLSIKELPKTLTLDSGQELSISVFQNTDGNPYAIIKAPFGKQTRVLISSEDGQWVSAELPEIAKQLNTQVGDIQYHSKLSEAPIPSPMDNYEQFNSDLIDNSQIDKVVKIFNNIHSETENPVPQGQLTSEQEKQELLDKANDTLTENDQLYPQQTRICSVDQVDGKPNHYRIAAYSTLMYELGVEMTDGPISAQHLITKKRIDSINGLIRLKTSRRNLTISQYSDILDKLHSIIYSYSTREEALTEIKKYLSEVNLVDDDGIPFKVSFKVDDLDVAEYVITKQSGISEYETETSDGEKRTVKLNMSPQFAERGIGRLMYSENEKLAHVFGNDQNSSDINRSEEVNKCKILFVLGKKGEKNKKGEIKTNYVLSIPVAQTENPYTIIKTERSIPDDVRNFYNNIKNQTISDSRSGETRHFNQGEINEQMINYLDTHHPELKEISDLLKLFHHSSNIAYFIKDEQFHIGAGLHRQNSENPRVKLLGNRVSQSKGKHNFTMGREFNISMENPNAWIPVVEFAKNKGLNISPIYMAKRDKAGIKAGHPLIFMSQHELSNDEMYRQWLRQQQNGYQGDIIVQRIYVLPPTFTFSEYIDNLEKLITKNDPNYNIGSKVTSYELWDALFSTENEITNAIMRNTTSINAEIFKQIHTEFNKIKESVKSVPNSNRWNLIANALSKDITISIHGYTKSYKLSGALNYGLRTIFQNQIYNDGSFTPNEHLIMTAQLILEKSNKYIFANSKFTAEARNQSLEDGDIIEIQQEFTSTGQPLYSVAGKQFTLNAIMEPYMFFIDITEDIGKMVDQEIVSKNFGPDTKAFINNTSVRGFHNEKTIGNKTLFEWQKIYPDLTELSENAIIIERDKKLQLERSNNKFAYVSGFEVISQEFPENREEFTNIGEVNYNFTDIRDINGENSAITITYKNGPQDGKSSTFMIGFDRTGQLTYQLIPRETEEEVNHQNGQLRQHVNRLLTEEINDIQTFVDSVTSIDNVYDSILQLPLLNKANPSMQNFTNLLMELRNADLSDPSVINNFIDKLFESDIWFTFDTINEITEDYLNDVLTYAHETGFIDDPNVDKHIFQLRDLLYLRALKDKNEKDFTACPISFKL